MFMKQSTILFIFIVNLLYPFFLWDIAQHLLVLNGAIAKAFDLKPTSYLWNVNVIFECK